MPTQEELTAGQKMTMNFESSDLDRPNGGRKPYKDTKGKLTVGYGINLDDPYQKKMITELGYKGGEISDEIAHKAFLNAYTQAQKDAVQYIGQETYDSLDQTRRDVLNDMSYNLGLNKLSGFENMRKNLLAGDYRGAAKEMVNSDWYKQVGNRSKALEGMMKGQVQPKVDKAQMTFGDAFRSARKMGLKTFTFNGKLFTTETK